MTHIEALRALLQRDTATLAPGCYDALSALLIERCEFEAAYVSGGSIAYSRLGRPDIGLVTATEVASTVALIRERVDLPLIVDADTGFGNALNVQRTIRMFERMGASCIQLEDQRSPKRCGHLAGKSLVSTHEMVGRLKAALDARDSALIMAHTDALAIEGWDGAMTRAEAYLEAGAEVLFVEAPRSRKELSELALSFGARVPLLANMVEGGVTPMVGATELGALGFRLVIFPGAIVRALTFAVERMLRCLRTQGTTLSEQERMLDLTELNRLLGTGDLLEVGRRFDADIETLG